MFLPLRDINPPLRRPVVTPVLIAVNVALFVLQPWISETPFAFHESSWRTGDLDGITGLFTYQFIHGGWAHLLGNMWFLYIFGDNVEASLGRGRYLLFYLVSGIAAALVEVYLDPGFGGNEGGILVGASGSISGILAAYLLRYPHARILTWFLWVAFAEIRAVWYILIWIGMQFFFQYFQSGTPTAYMAHIGGFSCGLIMYGLYHSFRRIRIS